MATEDPQDIARKIGRRIAELRRAKGMTQRDVAKKLGVTIPWVSRIETAGVNVTIRTLVRIAGALGVPSRDLWDSPSTRAGKRGRPKRPD